MKEKIMRQQTPFFIGILMSLVFTTVGCSSHPAKEIVLKSLEAHGGKKTWERTKKVSYTKATTLFTEQGAVEKEVYQNHEVYFQPFKAMMTWQEGATTNTAQLENDSLMLQRNSKSVTTPKVLQETKAVIEGAYYVFWQPYRLLEPEAWLELLGTRTLFNGKKTIEVLVCYSDAPEADRWHYFFDENSYRLVATGVVHQGRRSLITNDAYQTRKGIVLNRLRTSYFTDANFQPKYKRASYVYTVTDVVLEK